MKTATPATTMTFRRLNPDAPVGLRADACLPLRSRHTTECDRCVEACPAGVLHRSEEFFSLDDGCLGCGRCAAACPMGAIAVTGFALRPSEIKVTRPLTLDCWRVPTEASPAHSVRVPCLGGLSSGQWLGLVLAARGDAPEAASLAASVCACCSPGVELLDRGWCGAFPRTPARRTRRRRHSPSFTVGSRRRACHGNIGHGWCAHRCPRRRRQCPTRATKRR